MIPAINVARWEWFKLRRRWMPWILLAVLLLFSQLGVWSSFFFYRNLESMGGSIQLPGQERQRAVTVSCNALLGGDVSGLPTGTSPEVIQGMQAQCQQLQQRQQADLERLYGEFTLPGSIRSALIPGQMVGLILMAILTASVIGAEYGLGTLRQIMAKGTSRWAALAGKFVMLLVAVAGSLAVVAAVTVLSSLIASGLANPATAGGAEGATWGDATAALTKTWSSFIPYIALAGAVTVLARSTAAGMALGLGYYFGEQILVALLANVFDWLRDAAQYLPIHNISAWAGASGFGVAAPSLSTGETAVVLTVYSVAFAAFAFWLFHRRDITGATGG